MATLKAKFVAYTTVAVILVLHVSICGQLKTALFKASKISHNFHRKLEKNCLQNQKAQLFLLLLDILESTVKPCPCEKSGLKLI